MTLSGRIGKLEEVFGPKLSIRPRLETVVEDDAGQWWQDGKPVEREAVEARRPRLLRVYHVVGDPDAAPGEGRTA